VRPILGGGAFAVGVVCAGLFFGIAAMRGGAAARATPTVAVPSAPGSHTVTWTGMIPASSARQTRNCNHAGPGKADVIDVVIARSLPRAVFTIAWKPISNDEASSDEVLTVDGPNGPIGSSDGSGTTESVVAEGLAPGRYTVLACGDVNIVSQNYTGTLTIDATP
jgi:hypothetical protein